MDLVTLALAKKSAGGKGEKGDTGVGIKEVTATTSTADSMVNTVTITLTDNSKYEFGVKNGNRGSQGKKGDTGASPNVTIGTVTTLAAGSQATATITGTTPDLVLNLGIPKGDKGDKGATGTVADYESRIAALEAELEACKGEKESLQARLKDIESRLAALETPAAE